MRSKSTVLAILFCALFTSSVSGEIVVMKGDTLWNIAARELGDGSEWKKIAGLNGIREPFTIVPGQVLILPGDEFLEGTANAMETVIVKAPAVLPDAARNGSVIFNADEGKGGEFQAGTGLSSLRVGPTPSVVTAPTGMRNDMASAQLNEVLRGSSDLEIPPLPTEIIRSGVPVKLETLIQIALERNLPLLAGRVATKSSEADILASLAAFDPDFSIAAEQDYSWTTRYGVSTPVRTRTTSYGTSVSGKMSNSTEYSISMNPTRTRVNPQSGLFDANYANSYTLSVTQPILKGMGRKMAYADVEVAQLSSKASQEDLSALIESTIFRVENAYWTLLESEASEQVAKNSRNVARQLAQRNLELFKRGLSSELAVITAKQGLAQREASLTRANQSRIDAMEELIFLVYGQSAVEQLRSGGREIQTVPSAIDPPKLPSVEKAIGEALILRNDVASARRQLESALVTSAVTRNALLPDLSVTGSVTQGNTSSDFEFQATGVRGERTDNSWTAGLVLSIPIGNNSAQASHQKALLGVESKRIALETAESSVREEVRKALRAVQMVSRQLDQSESAAQLAARQLEGERKLLDLGLTDTFKVLQVEEQSANASLSAIQAKSSLARAITEYHRSLGRISEKYFSEGMVGAL